MDGSGYKKFKEVVEAQGGNPQVLDKFELLPNATGVREITSPRAGYVSVIDAEDIGVASNMIGAGRDTQGRRDRSGGGRDSGSEGRREGGCRRACSAASTTPRKTTWKKPPTWWKTPSASPAQKPEERELILEVVG